MTTTSAAVKATRYMMAKPCKDCGERTSALLTTRYPASDATGGPVFYCNGWICVSCRGCGKPKIAHLVKGKISHQHECDAKCMSSRGFKCECSCGGKNHGASYEAVASAVGA